MSDKDKQVLVIIAVVAVGGYLLWQNWSGWFGNTQELKTQLADVNAKIAALPELEKDIFTKCMEGKDGTAVNIRICQENTQKQVFTLSQELINLKKSLEQQLNWKNVV